ncbi:hypothetical protein BDY21DRAFT_343469 [Lineolata rhizophorae]|uniref:UspA domain-containing protein n=1 Tax=Lineolata rhizophorae TaxID=578093 RepID=A0A6A6P2T7_9PEZI|nr:hypothetical protein BDY21DRAFT_343469 [Lineolata rhizophorae]
MSSPPNSPDSAQGSPATEEFLKPPTPSKSPKTPKSPKLTGRTRGQFQPRVSFDTFDTRDSLVEENSFTLIRKHKDYEYSKRSRTFLCGLDSNDYSEYALEWLIDELVDDGDEIVCLRVVEKDSSVAADPSVDEGRYRMEAERLMEKIQEKNTEQKAINLILEFAVGKTNKVIDEMINLYEPAMLIVGTRGRSLGGFQGLLPGSVSKYCLQHSPVPVIVVRPNSKRAKTKKKRLADPARQGYQELLRKSGGDLSHILDSSHRNSLVDLTPTSNSQQEAEAVAVAAAIGVNAKYQESPLSQMHRAEPHTPVTEGPPDDVSTKSPGVVMKSPDSENLDSPISSSVSSSEPDELDGRFDHQPSQGESIPVPQSDDVSPRTLADDPIAAASATSLPADSSKPEESPKAEAGTGSAGVPKE